MRYILIAFIIFIAYRFIFHFLIPVIITTRKVRKSFREMHERMQAEQSNTSAPGQEGSYPRPNEDDYIEYEEVK